MGPDDLPEVFRELAAAATELADPVLRAEFLGVARDFLVEPTAPQRMYLESLSQGYFLYHLVGLDPVCNTVRTELFDRTLWIVDSSVILPLAAVGCYNHSHADDLFRRLAGFKVEVFTTEKLMQEAWEHLEWALNFVEANSTDSPEFLAAAALMSDYRQNLFIDGFIRLSADGRVSTFQDYLDVVCPGGCTRPVFEGALTERGIAVLSDLAFQAAELSTAEAMITDRRKALGTYRSELQVKAEAEVWQLIADVRAGDFKMENLRSRFDREYFVSQSHILDRLAPGRNDIVTWTPEAVYRYITSLPGESTDPDLLQQCMLQDYYYAGVSFIDRPRYQKYFGPSVNQARLSYNEQKEKYLQEAARTNTKELDERFEQTPDLQKPFFVAQMGWRVAERAEYRAKQAEIQAARATEKARRLEAERDGAWKKRATETNTQEEARRRNLLDPKHIRRRLKQRKKRRKH